MATLRELIIKVSANSQSFQTEIARASRMGQDYYKTMQNGGRQAAIAAKESQRLFFRVNGWICFCWSGRYGSSCCICYW